MSDDALHDHAVKLRTSLGRLTRFVRQRGSTTLTQSQLSALATLDEFGSMRLGVLGQYEGVAPSVMSRLSASLEELDLVQRTPDPQDGRAFLVMITEQGRDLLYAVQMERETALTEQLSRLSSDDRDVLVRALPVLDQISRPPTIP